MAYWCFAVSAHQLLLTASVPTYYTAHLSLLEPALWLSLRPVPWGGTIQPDHARLSKSLQSYMLTAADYMWADFVMFTLKIHDRAWSDSTSMCCLFSFFLFVWVCPSLVCTPLLLWSAHLRSIIWPSQQCSISASALLLVTSASYFAHIMSACLSSGSALSVPVEADWVTHLLPASLPPLQPSNLLSWTSTIPHLPDPHSPHPVQAKATTPLNKIQSTGLVTCYTEVSTQTSW